MSDLPRSACVRLAQECLCQTGTLKLQSFLNAFSVLQVQIRDSDNPKSSQHSTIMMARIIQLFINKPKAHVQEKLIDKERECNSDHLSLESVYHDAMAKDSLIFSASLTGPVAQTGTNPSPAPPDCGTASDSKPWPPALLAAFKLLASLGSGCTANGKPIDCRWA